MNDYMIKLRRFGAAAVAIDALIEDLTARQGFKHLWDALDRETRREIRSSWGQIIQHTLDAERHVG